MRFLSLVTSLAAAFTFSVPAQAYCCKTHPAICVAACGRACCSKPEKIGYGGQAGMSKIPTAELREELRAIGRDSPVLTAAINRELAQPARQGKKPLGTR